MKKRPYERPTAEAIRLQLQQHLLAVSAEISGYRQRGGGFSQDDEDEDLDWE